MPAEALHGTAVTLDFLVFSTGYDIVIGINDILNHFLHVLWDALGGSRMVEYGRMNNLVDEVSTSELIEPFDSILETSPEELFTPEPCSFSYALDFLGRNLRDVYAEYELIYPTFISLEHRDNARMREILSSEKAKLTFCPQN